MSLFVFNSCVWDPVQLSGSHQLTQLLCGNSNNPPSRSLSVSMLLLGLVSSSPTFSIQTTVSQTGRGKVTVLECKQILELQQIPSWQPQATIGILKLKLRLWASEIKTKQTLILFSNNLYENLVLPYGQDTKRPISIDAIFYLSSEHS